MSFFFKKSNWFLFFIFAIIFSAQVVPRFYQESPTNDEPNELTNGYFYWRGDVRRDNFHPPLSKLLQALPLRFLTLRDPVILPGDQIPSMSYHFFFDQNRNQFENMMALGRSVALMFGLAMGALIFWVTRKNFRLSFFALTLWCFEPNLLAYSGLCLADLSMAFFFFAAILVFELRPKSLSVPHCLAVGILSAMAVGSKFSALCLPVIFLFLTLLENHHNLSAVSSTIRAGWEWLWGSLGFILFLGLLYLPGTLMDPAHRNPFFYFGAGLMNMIHFSSVHYPSYFMGWASRSNHWFYFPLVFVLKTTLPFLLLTLLSIGLGIFYREWVKPWLWLPPLVFFCCILPVQNIGVRYLLPLFPFLILMNAEGLKLLLRWKPSFAKNAGRLLVFFLLTYHATTSLGAEPGMISYFNEIVPQQKRLYYLSDCNLDIGQDIKRVALFAQKKGWKKVKLAQMGGAIDPSAYGLTWNYWSEADIQRPQPGTVYLANAFLFQMGPVFEPSLLPIARGWMIQTVPTGMIGGTWYYYEIPGKPLPDTSPMVLSVHIF